MKNTISSYGLVSRILHWSISAIIICLLGVGFYMSDLPNSPAKFEIYAIHKATGVLVLSLIIFRLIWRWMNIVPDMLKTVPKWQSTAYSWGVRFMYILMLGMPITGMFMTLFGGRDLPVFGLFTISAFLKDEQISYIAWKLHGIGAWAFVFFITVHSLMALYHHLVVKDRLLSRMMVGE